jgi:hypothetical protein
MLETGTAMGTACTLDCDDDRGTADDAMVYIQDASECACLSTTARLGGAGAVYVGVAIVDKTNGCCIEGRCAEDDVTVGTAVVERTSGGGHNDDNDDVVGMAFVERTKGGRVDDGVFVGTAVVERVMGGREDTKHDIVEVELDIGL